MNACRGDITQLLATMSRCAAEAGFQEKLQRKVVRLRTKSGATGNEGEKREIYPYLLEGTQVHMSRTHLEALNLKGWFGRGASEDSCPIATKKLGRSSLGTGWPSR